MVGLEHEYRVMEGSAQVDFRPLIGRLALGRPNLDPGDPNAYRLRSGSMITCDGAEAEIALPPTPLTPGFATAMSARAAGEEFELAKLLHPRFRLDGCSTHISVAVDDSHTRAVAALYARTFAPAMMLMLDGPHSPGLLVRPRPGRVELGGEFVAGPRLMAAVNFAVGSVLACVSAIADPGSIPLPPMLAIEPEPARERYGWYVDRRAFGSDLYVTGRDTPLSLQTGSTTTAQRHLVQSWAAARAALHPLLNPEDAALVDAMVNGDLPLAVEAPPDPSPRATETPRPDPTAAAVLGPLRRPQFEMAPVMVTWEIAVLMLANQRQVATRRRDPSTSRRASWPTTALPDGGDRRRPVRAFRQSEREFSITPARCKATAAADGVRSATSPKPG